jgi:uncharacterized protein involved in outer membrane biogenesis
MTRRLFASPRTRAGRVLLWTGVGLVTFLVVLGLAVFFMDWNLLRGPATRLASAKLGRPVHIHGDLEVWPLSLAPTVTVHQLEIDNPPWAGRGSLLRAERVTARIELLPLLAGDVVLPSLRIERPRVSLWRDANGRANWELARRKSPRKIAPVLPVIHRFEVESGHVSYVDELRNVKLEGVVAASERGPDDHPFRLVTLGTFNGDAFRLQLKGAALVNARPGKPYPFGAELNAADVQLEAQGEIAKAFDLNSLRAQFVVTGHDLARLYALTGLTFPNTPPYRISGRMAREGSQVAFEDLSGKIGDSDMRGAVTVDLRRERPLVTARVESDTLDLDDVATWFGAPPSQAEGESVAPEQKQLAERMAAQRKLFPDAKLQVSRMRVMDAQVEYRAHDVKANRFSLRSAALDASLQDGVLVLKRFALEMPQGDIEGTLRLDATGDVPRTVLDARVSNVQLGQFKPKGSPEAPLEGVLRARVKLEGEGNSVHEFASGSEGTITAVLPHGEVREAFAELTGVNVARGLGLLLQDDAKQVEVRCGVASLRASDGTLKVSNFVFDTNNVVITGEGEITLKDERFALEIKGQPKKMRLLRLRTPVAIRGPLRKPSVGLGAEGETAVQGVAAALAALVTPLAAVVAFVDPGLAEDADCASLMAEAKAGGVPAKTAEIEAAGRKR